MSLGDAHELATPARRRRSPKKSAPTSRSKHTSSRWRRAKFGGRDADPALVATDCPSPVHNRGRAAAALSDIHDVRVRHTPGGYFVNFPLLDRSGLSVDATHEEVDALERSLRNEFPDVIRIVGHAEPTPRRG